MHASNTSSGLQVRLDSEPIALVITEDYVNDIDAGEPGDPLTIEDIANGEDFIGWVKDGLGPRFRSLFPQFSHFSLSLCSDFGNSAHFSLSFRSFC